MPFDPKVMTVIERRPVDTEKSPLQYQKRLFGFLDRVGKKKQVVADPASQSGSILIECVRLTAKALIIERKFITTHIFDEAPRKTAVETQPNQDPLEVISETQWIRRALVWYPNVMACAIKLATSDQFTKYANIIRGTFAQRLPTTTDESRAFAYEMKMTRDSSRKIAVIALHPDISLETCIPLVCSAVDNMLIRTGRGAAIVEKESVWPIEVMTSDERDLIEALAIVRNCPYQNPSTWDPERVGRIYVGAAGARGELVDVAALHRLSKQLGKGDPTLLPAAVIMSDVPMTPAERCPSAPPHAFVPSDLTTLIDRNWFFPITDDRERVHRLFSRMIEIAREKKNAFFSGNELTDRHVCELVASLYTESARDAVETATTVADACDAAFARELVNFIENGLPVEILAYEGRLVNDETMECFAAVTGEDMQLGSVPYTPELLERSKIVLSQLVRGYMALHRANSRDVRLASFPSDMEGLESELRIDEADLEFEGDDEFRRICTALLRAGAGTNTVARHQKARFIDKIMKGLDDPDKNPSYSRTIDGILKSYRDPSIVLGPSPHATRLIMERVRSMENNEMAWVRDRRTNANPEKVMRVPAFRQWILETVRVITQSNIRATIKTERD